MFLLGGTREPATLAMALACFQPGRTLLVAALLAQWFKVLAAFVAEGNGDFPKRVELCEFDCLAPNPAEAFASLNNL